MEWSREQYNKQYERWVPWLEDIYLRYFTRDNKASYTAKDTLDKTKVTGIEQVDTIQDGVNNLAAGQLGQGGLAQPIGDMASNHGVNRLERQGKNDSGGYSPDAPSPVAQGGNTIIGGAVAGGKTVTGTAQSGLESVGGLLG